MVQTLEGPLPQGGRWTLMVPYPLLSFLHEAGVFEWCIMQI